MSINNRKAKSDPSDYTSSLPDECLALILETLTKCSDRNNSSLVCRRWLAIEGHTRRRLSLHAQFDISPSLFTRFDSITELALIRRHGTAASIVGRTALTLISLSCTFLTRLTLRNCKVSSCGVDALSNTCARLEELHLQQVEIGKAFPLPDASSLTVIRLLEMDMSSVYLLAPLIKASRSLRALNLKFRLPPYHHRLDYPLLDTLLHSIAHTLTEYHLEADFLNDKPELGVISSCCPNLQILHLVFCNFSDAGIAMVANKCRSLRKLHIDAYSRSHAFRYQIERNYDMMIQDEGLIAVAKNCPNLQELFLAGVRVTQLSLGVLGSHCLKLERLALYCVQTVTGAELKCIAANCNECVEEVVDCVIARFLITTFKLLPPGALV